VRDSSLDHALTRPYVHPWHSRQSFTGPCVSFSDLDRNLYSDHTLTIARHPSETEERMMIRLLAYVLNAPANNDLGSLEFGKDHVGGG
jgi:hypothetical protein